MMSPFSNTAFAMMRSAPALATMNKQVFQVHTCPSSLTMDRGRFSTSLVVHSGCPWATSNVTFDDCISWPLFAILRAKRLEMKQCVAQVSRCAVSSSPASSTCATIMSSLPTLLTNACTFRCLRSLRSSFDIRIKFCKVRLLSSSSLLRLGGLVNASAAGALWALLGTDLCALVRRFCCVASAVLNSADSLTGCSLFGVGITLFLTSIFV